jgi:hypothetical protein
MLKQRAMTPEEFIASVTSPENEDRNLEFINEEID